MTDQNPVIQWLLTGDPAIRWQTFRDLIGAEFQIERGRVAIEG